MAYGMAVHGSWCGARAYPTRCRYCGRNVFYFECNCGSKVFFSELGGEWPEHRCLKMLEATYGKEFVQRGMARQIMKHPASRLVTRIEKRFEEAVRRQFEGRGGSGAKWAQRIDAVNPRTVEDAAVVKEIEKKVDVFRRLGLETRSKIAMAFLGELSNRSHGQVTFHVGGLQESAVESYTAFAPTELLESLMLERGDLVSVTLVSTKIGGGKWVWLTERIEFLT